MSFWKNFKMKNQFGQKTRVSALGDIISTSLHTDTVMYYCI